MLTAILPLKNFSHAKQRLAGALTASERQHFFYTMVRDVLDAVAFHPLLDKVILLSSDPLAELLAEKYHVCYLPESNQLATVTINSALTAAMQQLPEASQELLIIHGDLPGLSVENLSRFIVLHQQLAMTRKHSQASLTIAKDQLEQGSNLLMFSAPLDYNGAVNKQLDFMYGRGSLQKYQQQAAQKSWLFQSVSIPALASDIDMPADLFQLLNNSGLQQKRCVQFLRQPQLLQRLQLLQQTVEKGLHYQEGVQ